ncbi:MAG TPA: peptide ligase PGM1-related protein [Actinomycetota bacterium]|nr:peptide ligase PGM1-related protein [Actinomycetota bacterium]
MSTLFVGNVDCDAMVGEPWRMSYKEKCGSAGASQRLAWLMQDGDALVCPTPMSDAFMRYMGEINGVDTSTMHVITPDVYPDDITLVTFDVLSSPEMLDHVKRILPTSQQWDVKAYYFDRAVAWLAEHLGLDVEGGALPALHEGCAETLNSKLYFRRIAAGHGVPVAEGAVCSTRAHMRVAIQDIFDVTGRVIVKQDLAAGGGGNVIVSRNEVESPSGSTEIVQVGGRDDLLRVADDLWDRLIGPRNTTLILEAYYDNVSTVYSELDIAPGAARPELLNYGDMRMEPLWVGFEIPTSTLGPYQLGEFLSVSMQLASIARDTGYRGKINCDALKTTDDRVVFTEINGRLGGCTHVHVVAQRLFGRDYGDRYTILTRNKVRCPPFERTLEILRERGLLLSPGDRHGVVILIEDEARRGIVEYMVAAPGRSEALEIEAETLRALEEGLT